MSRRCRQAKETLQHYCFKGLSAVEAFENAHKVMVDTTVATMAGSYLSGLLALSGGNAIKQDGRTVNEARRSKNDRWKAAAAQKGSLW